MNNITPVTTVAKGVNKCKVCIRIIVCRGSDVMV